MSTDLSHSLQAAVREAVAAHTALCITGNSSKSFYGHPVDGAPLAVSDHRGVIDYAPTELVITARCGTPLREIASVLDEQTQMLPFDPPYADADATLGGAIAAGLSGPGRPYYGAARDFVLGMHCLTGHGVIDQFGGQVMKNVAGYDVARLMTGALGTLGVILDVSLKVLPRPECELTLIQDTDLGSALVRLREWRRLPLPLTGASFAAGQLRLRLSGSEAGVRAAQARIGGEASAEGHAYWQALRDQTLPFFADDTALWRLSLPPASPPPALPGQLLMDWGGAQYWLRSDAAAEDIRRVATALGGHATWYRGDLSRAPIFQPLAPGVAKLHRALKAAFDPHAIMNPGRMYPGL